MRWPAALVLLLLVALTGAGGSVAVRRAASREAGSRDEPGGAGADAARAPVPRRRAEAPAGAPLPPSATRVVRGTVRDEQAEPVADVEIGVFPLDPAGRVVRDRDVIDFGHPLAASRTSADGSYEVSVMATRFVAVTARKPGFAPAACLQVADRATDMRLVSGDEVEFLIVDPRGAPISDAEVWLLWSDAGSCLVDCVTPTDAAGRARVNLDVYRQDVLVRAPGRADAEVHDLSPPGEVVRVVLGEGRRIAGVVVDGEGRPIPAARVTIRKARRYEDDSIRSAADGTFAFDGLDPRSDARGLSLHVALDGWAEPEAIDVAAGEENVRVVLHRACTVRGIVVHEDGRPAACADLGDSVTANADGRFEIHGLEPGRRTLHAHAPSPADSRIEFAGVATVDVPEGAVVEDVRIVLARPKDKAHVLVRVIDPAGHPVPGAIVNWACAGAFGSGGATADGTLLLTASAGAGRSIRMACSVTGPPRLDAWTDWPIDASPTGAIETFDLRLEPPGEFRLRVLDPEGRDVPVDRLRTEVWDRASNEYVERGTGGGFALPATAEFDLRVSVPGFADWRTSIRPPHGRLRTETVRLQQASRLSGRVTGADVTWMRVAVDLRSAAGGAMHRDDPLGEDGRFEFDSLASGPLALRVLDSDERVALRRELELAESEHLDLGDLQLGGPVTLRGVVADAAGRCVAGALVEFEDTGGVEACEPTCSRADGTWEVELAGAVPLLVRVSRTGLATQCIAAAPDSARPLRAVLGKPGSARVRIDSGMGAEAPHVLARVPGTTSAWEPPASEDPADDRVTVHGDLPEGPVEMVLRAGGLERTKLVHVAAGRTVDCVFE